MIDVVFKPDLKDVGNGQSFKLLERLACQQVFFQKKGPLSINA
jgi:hypothetical protein